MCAPFVRLYLIHHPLLIGTIHHQQGEINYLMDLIKQDSEKKIDWFCRAPLRFGLRKEDV